MSSTINSRKKSAIRINHRPPIGTGRSREPPVSGKTSGTPMNLRWERSLTFRFLWKLGAITTICVVVLVFVSSVHIQHGNRMYPFLMDGDLLIVYKLGDYLPGDAVLYRNPETGEKDVSRIAAVGQNEILITEEGQFLINRFSPDDQVFYPTQPLEGSDLRYPFQMAEGGYFLLDDFRIHGSDSRYFGDVTEDELLGKVIFVFRIRGI